MFDFRSRDHDDLPVRAHRMGTELALVEHHGAWQLSIQRRMSGTTIRRHLYSVQLTGHESCLREFMTGFTSLNSARNAALDKIEKLEDKYYKQSSADDDFKPIPDIVDTLKKQKKIKKIAGIAQRRRKD
ncbi:hypothetical protein [Blastopirellula marina]|uniref:Uncharacterized protein n=1 Tax=Blastopirellula marina DSM 3645 TaxID=314230 RepID=A4A2N7_9BACT|nr:hypothetical protein [Blastopirellula marina]EAQ76957.1 hypothetical protein DSM3645_06289 [Blastopirellula marina DSM 3645]